jgi:hypothetical protein
MDIGTHPYTPQVLSALKAQKHCCFARRLFCLETDLLTHRFGLECINNIADLLHFNPLDAICMIWLLHAFISQQKQSSK